MGCTHNDFNANRSNSHFIIDYAPIGTILNIYFNPICPLFYFSIQSSTKGNDVGKRQLSYSYGMLSFLRKIRWTSFILCFTIAAAGCVSQATSKPQWTQQLVVQDVRLNELSGLSESIRYPGYFWANNDSGDSLRCFLISPQGKTVALVNLKGYKSVDTESLRVAGVPGRSFVYISDTGDNRARRKHVQIYRFPEPEIDVKKGDQEMELPGEQMILKYGDESATDAETLLIDKNQRVGIVTKSFLGSKLWITPNPFSAGEQTLQLAGNVPVGKWKQRGQQYSLLFTDGAISNDGRHVALMTYTTLFIWKIPGGEDLLNLAKVLSSPPDIQETLPQLQQAESLSFTGNKSHIAVSSEGLNPPVMMMNFGVR